MPNKKTAKNKKSKPPRGRTRSNKACHMCNSTNTKYYYSATLSKLLKIQLWAGIYLCKRHFNQLEEEYEQGFNDTRSGDGSKSTDSKD